MPFVVASVAFAVAGIAAAVAASVALVVVAFVPFAVVAFVELVVVAFVPFVVAALLAFVVGILVDTRFEEERMAACSGMVVEFVALLVVAAAEVVEQFLAVEQLLVAFLR